MNIARQTITLAAFAIAGLGAHPAAAAVNAGFTDETAHKAPTLAVDRAQAPAILEKVKSAVAHAAPYFPAGKAPQGLRHAFASNLLNHGGPVVKTATIYNLYVNGTPADFGYPGSFLTDNSINGADQLLHVPDQYVGTNANNRYTYGGYIEPSYNTSSTLHDADIYNLVNAASNFYNASGYGAIFNVFLKPGVTECSTGAGGCYGTAPWTFCAYHGSVNLIEFRGIFPIIKHLLYTVEPAQNVAGCNAPSSNLSDSTASTLSHETNETITDPDLNAWFNASGSEIGDLCRFNYSNLYVGSAGSFFNRSFNLQQEWLNDANNGGGACGY